MRKEDTQPRSKPYPNHLKACIRRAGYKIQEIADEINMPRATLSDYIAGNRPVPRKSLEKIAHLLRCDIEELLEIPHERRLPEEHTVKSNSQETDQITHTPKVSAFSQKIFPETEVSSQNISSQFLGQEKETLANMKRRSVLQTLLQMAGTTLFFPPQELLHHDSWERFSMAILKPSSLDLGMLDDLQVITRRYWRLRKNMSSGELLDTVLGQFQMLVRMLQQSRPTKVSRALFSLASETAQLIGQMLFDRRDLSTAWSYYTLSISFAQTSHSYDLWAAGLGRMGLLMMYSHQAHEALPYLQEAQCLAVEDTVIRSWLAAVEAEVHAETKDAYTCSISLEKARNLLPASSKEDIYAVGFHQSRLEGYTGSCYVRLQQSEKALFALDKAVQTLTPDAIRRRSTLFTDQASAHMQLGNIEIACELAHQALLLTGETNSFSVLQRIRVLQQSMQLWSHLSVVAEVEDHLRELEIAFRE